MMLPGRPEGVEVRDAVVEERLPGWDALVAVGSGFRRRRNLMLLPVMKQEM